MPRALSLILCLFLSAGGAWAQNGLPVIRATSKQIKILDGDDLRHGELVPSLKPDVYPYHKSAAAKRVVYYTDVDSIAFDVHPGDTYEFIILLNDKDSCYQQLSAVNPYKIEYSRGGNKEGTDTIAFTLGANNAIHIKGIINGSDTLDLIFDTGASVEVLSDRGASKGVKLQPDNRMEVAGLTWQKVPVTYIDYNGSLPADGVIGYNAFEDKMVEIDYDRGIMVIHHQSFAPGNGYTATPIVWREANSFIEAELAINGKRCKGLFLFDTGSKWAISANHAFASKNNLFEGMKKLGTRRAKGVNGVSIKSHSFLLPVFIIAGIPLHNIPMDLELEAKEGSLSFNILGNDVLKRFNVIVDYQKSIIYLKPNSLVNTAYNQSVLEPVIIGIGAAVLVVLVGGYFLYRKRTRRNRKPAEQRV
jgi:hypothetical protein